MFRESILVELNRYQWVDILTSGAFTMFSGLVIGFGITCTLLLASDGKLDFAYNLANDLSTASDQVATIGLIIAGSLGAGLSIGYAGLNKK